ncbi:MAG: D-alanyl-D-alanine carboxypeptidase family protein [Acidimicrobiales bacterium]
MTLGVVVLLAIAYFVVQLSRPVPSLEAHTVLRPSVVVPTAGFQLPSSPGAETAVLVRGVGVLHVSRPAAPISMASVTKIMSALVVLADHPLRLGQSGPSITVTQADVASYESAKAAQDSVVAVQQGERLSELDALEASLVPSADNVVQMLARWDAGSIAAFVTRMNARARALGLTHTHYAGPSGVNPASVSTPSDQVRLAEIAMANPVIAHIVSLTQVTLPVAGVQYNVDAVLGHDGIVGIKTGWVPQGGASFVFASTRVIASRRVMVIGAIMGEKNASPVPTVLADAERLAHAVGLSLSRRRVVPAGTRVAVLEASYGHRVPVVTTRAVAALVWPGARLAQSVVISRKVGEVVHRGERVGTLTIRLHSEHITVPLVAEGANAGPSLGWRLARW